MTQDWQPFFDQKKTKFELDAEVVQRLEDRLSNINKGRRKGKLTMDHMLSHMLIDMGEKPPKIEAKKSPEASM